MLVAASGVLFGLGGLLGGESPLDQVGEPRQERQRPFVAGAFDGFLWRQAQGLQHDPRLRRFAPSFKWTRSVRLNMAPTTAHIASHDLSQSSA